MRWWSACPYPCHSTFFSKPLLTTDSRFARNSGLSIVRSTTPPRIGDNAGRCLALTLFRLDNLAMTTTSIAPSLSVRKGAAAIEFYKSAIGEEVVYRMDAPDGAVVARLSMNGAEFWVADESPENINFSPETLGGGTIRVVLAVPDSVGRG